MPMRHQDLIAIMLAVSAILSGAAFMVAPEYLHLPRYIVPLTFWGGISLALALIFLAAAIARRGEISWSNLAVSPRSNAPRNVPLIDAVWRAHLGRWNERANYGDDWRKKAPFHKTCAAIRQNALDGKLPVWGTNRLLEHT